MKAEKPDQAVTELMRQYRQLKEKYAGALLLFQVGDFYETFEEDAKIVSEVLGIVLTRRNNGAAGQVPLAGFPMKALESHLPKLVEAGYRVAICEQVEEPKKEKGVVKREVVDIVTPAVHWLASTEFTSSQYLAVFWAHRSDAAALALADVATSGRVLCYEGPLSEIERILHAFAPVEIVVYENQDTLLPALYPKATQVEVLASWYFDPSALGAVFEEVYQYALSPLDQRQFSMAEQAVLAALLAYLRSLRQTQLAHLLFPKRLPLEAYFLLDPITVRNLEIVEPLHPEGKSLLDVMGQTATLAGRRLLRQWLLMPLRQQALIEERLDRLEALYALPSLHQTWYELLKGVGDLERRVARLSARRTQPRDLAQLHASLKNLLELQATLPPPWQQLDQSVLKGVLALLEHYLMLSPEPPYIGEKPGEGKVIREGLDPELDRARKLNSSAAQAIKELEEKERLRTGIRVKIGQNRHIGYYIEVSPSHIKKVPPDYRLRQNLPTGGQRFTSKALDELASELSAANERIQLREEALYGELLQKLQPWLAPLQKIAHTVAALDATLALARLAYEQQYTRPTFTEAPVIEIKGGRHPVIERYLPLHQPYQPNDLMLTEEQRILLLTGPNMAGKSAYMRQNALILLLAHIGSFVPAESARLCLVDQLYSRVGASDNLAAGQSTFWVEMTEAARILRQATSRSFVILDEVGRGTSTYDGLAIAWAMVEYLHSAPHQRPWVLFATHYHELTELEKTLPRLKNYHLAVEERQEKLIFLHKLRRGPMRRSFGITVAEKAGLPPSVISRARELLAHLEKKQPLSPAALEPTLFNDLPKVDGLLAKKLLELDLNALTPIEALFRLQELQNLAKKV